ncbi:MAG: SDR family oxidoreductase [Planctomycetes bacterium]|nr:SDR family oxidoreductase [Planctomycetota bacterium]
MTAPYRKEWALILGASSGFGGATAIGLARAGWDVFGVHLDRKATLPNVEAIIGEIERAGRTAVFLNANAADPDKRREFVDAIAEKTSQTGSRLTVLLHSLAFGSMKPYASANPAETIKEADMNMTLDVMAHSLVYWVRDLVAKELLARGSKIFAMTSAGGHRVWPTYGPVSASKAALEAHVRQLAVELSRHGIAANSIRAGVTDTPALRRIPGNEVMMKRALEMNPGGRLTTPEDVAQAIVALSTCPTTWITGNVIGVDGGEDLVG